MIKFLLFFFGGFLVCAAFGAQIYQWTDDNGRVHFSDIPHLGATVINQKSAPIVTAPAVIKAQSIASKSNQHDFKIAIIEPVDQATIRNNQGYIAIRAHITPELKSGFKIQILLDGVATGSSFSTLSATLNDIDRGAHRLELQLIDKHGALVSRSSSITVFMQRPRINMGQFN